MGLIKFARLSVRKATPCRRLLKREASNLSRKTAGARRTTAKAATLRSSVIGIVEAGNIVLALARKHDMSSDLLRHRWTIQSYFCTGLFFSF
jgi:hypothetical protein